ncbi:unnamed protein product [Mesocestoides corti]|uniref:Uncharacterized protein n=1 Tax=Mesocestoides corti TaxID=53468 RepID=A0A3P6GWL7_MESCO|nr:unnamed protein product [Mesocestoides corti]
MMECVIGIAFKDFVIIAAYYRINISIMTLKGHADKVFKSSNHSVMAVCGEAGDVIASRHLMQLQTTRKNLAEALRSRTPYNVNLPLAGYDPKDGP